jgi:hypothetical protein
MLIASSFLRKRLGLMSVIHWNKSVLTLHLREMSEDHHRQNSLALDKLTGVYRGHSPVNNGQCPQVLVKGLVKTGWGLASCSVLLGEKISMTPVPFCP